VIGDGRLFGAGGAGGQAAARAPDAEELDGGVAEVDAVAVVEFGLGDAFAVEGGAVAAGQIDDLEAVGVAVHAEVFAAHGDVHEHDVVVDAAADHRAVAVQEVGLPGVLALDDGEFAAR
jgi:hypothetical protein